MTVLQSLQKRIKLRHWPDLLVNLVDPDGVDLWVEVVEWEVLEAEEETVELAVEELTHGENIS